MKTSIAPFLAGAAFGIASTTLATYSIFNQEVSGKMASTVANVQHNFGEYPASENLTDALAMLDATTSRLEKSADKLAALNQTRATASASHSKSINVNVAPEKSAHSDSTSTKTRNHSPAIPIQSSPATPIQIDLYQSIETRLYDAADNQNTISNLVKEAEGLTPTQRDELTQVALEMIQSGELDSNQLNPNYESNSAW